MDFLFWLRRFKIAKIQTNISEVDFDRLFIKIREFVKSKLYNFRNLVNIYFDLTYLNKSADEIITEILNELKVDTKSLTPFTVIQLLQATSKKDTLVTAKGYNLVDVITRNLTNLLPEFDNDQKCQIFKYLAQLELDLNPPKYRTPNILYVIKTQLKESLDKLSELSVSNIIDAYEFLPKEFPVDIIDDIKEMVLLTIVHNSTNIKSSFLLEFLQKIMNLRKHRRLYEDKVNLIYDEIAKRLSTDDYLSRIRNLEKLLAVYNDTGIKNHNLLQKIYERLSKNEKISFSNVIFDTLNRGGVEIIPYIQKVINHLL